MARTDIAASGFSGSERYEFVRGRLAQTGQRAVLWMHGRAAASLTGTGARADVRDALASREMLAFSSDYGSSAHWANSTALSRAGTAKTLAQAAPWSAASGKVMLCGQSMGSLLALLWTLANPTLVSAVAIGLPLVNFLGFYSENRGGFQSEISTARGGAPDSTADPQSRASEYAALGIPTKLWASSDDTLCPLSEAQTFGAAVGAEVVSMGAQGHAVSAGFAGEAADFLAAHL